MKHVKIDELPAQSCLFISNKAPPVCACSGRFQANPYAVPSTRGPAQIEACPECGVLFACQSAGTAALRIAIANDLM
jgi:hypothetical protein